MNFRKFLLVDPTDKEECVMNGRMMMAMNIHREICGAVMGGGVSLETEQVNRNYSCMVPFNSTRP